MQIKKGDKLTVTGHRASSIEHRVLILGIGNILLKDEGVGVHVAQQLYKYDLPDNVEVTDGGTTALDILLSQESLHKLVVIDAIRAGKKPGTIVKLKIRNLKFEIPVDGQSQLSLHQLDLLDAIAVAKKMDTLPEEIVVIGVEPAEIDLGLELTDKVAQSIPQVIEQVLEEIGDVIHRE